MQVLVHKSDKHPTGSWNEVADLEILIPPEQNTADFVNDVLIRTISKTGFHAIGGEVRWEKNSKGQNVVRYFGATEGRVKLASVIRKIKKL
jgi:hypothetical protein